MFVLDKDRQRPRRVWRSQSPRTPADKIDLREFIFMLLPSGISFELPQSICAKLPFYRLVHLHTGICNRSFGAAIRCTRRAERLD